MTQHILTTTETARILGISVRTAQTLVESGAIRSWKTPGGHRRVYRSDVLAFKEGAALGPDTTSALLFVYASGKRLTRIEKVVSTVQGYTARAFSQPQSLAIALGLDRPAALILDMEEDAAERWTLLSEILRNPELSHMQVVALFSHRNEIPNGINAKRVQVTVQLSALSDVILSLTKGVTLNGLDRSDIQYPLGMNERERLRAVQRSGLLDSPPESIFDEITSLAARNFGVPIAQFTLLSEDRQWFKSHHGSALAEIPRQRAFCNHTILGRGIFAVSDLSADPMFCSHPAVAGEPHFRFYAGAPVLDSAGFALGSLCIMDFRPHQLAVEQRETLLALAHFASEAVQLRNATRQLRWSQRSIARQGL